MSSRNVILTALLFLTLTIGAAVLLREDTASLRNALRSTEVSEGTGLPNRAIKFSDVTDSLVLNLYYVARLLTSNKDLILYGGIALFGILMMGLAISSASSAAGEKKDQMVELLTQEKERAENLARLKSEFLNQVSHELRTPLAVIIGYLECINDGLYGKLESKHQEILHAVAKQSSHLKNMIDQILIYSRLEASKQPLRIDDFHLNRIINDLRETFDFLCKQKGLQLRWELPRETITVRSDFERFKELLSNLLQNAVKYTDRGSVSVRMHRLTSTDSIMVEVADSGLGIPEHYLSTIFEPFMQAHKTPFDNGRGGIGLGLSIVKKHLEQLRGTITVESEPGKGSTFRIILPRIYYDRNARQKWLLKLLKLRFSRGEKPSISDAEPSTAKVREATKPSQAVG